MHPKNKISFVQTPKEDIAKVNFFSLPLKSNIIMLPSRKQKLSVGKFGFSTPSKKQNKEKEEALMVFKENISVLDDR